jgi:hypothetical protein
VLYKRTTRDWLFLLRDETGGEMYQLYYTEDIVAEAVARIRDNNQLLSGEQVTWIADQLRSNIRVDSFAIDADSYPGPDDGDLHVHSAAQTPEIEKLVTFDTGFLGLTDDQKDTLTYEIFTPDEFFMLVQDSAPDVVQEVTRNQFHYWYKRLRSRPDLPGKLTGASCPQFARVVAQHIEDLGL